jgi:hypothetical protein
MDDVRDCENVVDPVVRRVVAAAVWTDHRMLATKTIINAAMRGDDIMAAVLVRL